MNDEAATMAPLILMHVEAEELDRAASFYARAFGLIVGRRLGPQVVELIGAEAPIHLLARPAAPPGDSGLRPPVQLDLVVEDIEAARERARHAGALVEGGVRDHAWGSIAQLTDPFGNRVCLLSFRRPGLEEAAAPWLPAGWILAAGAAVPASRPEREAGRR
jgi:predicted enzyme related to lactoylglutathione lyase